MKNFKGFTIFPCSPNAAGMRWYTRTEDGRTLKADTLSGIMNLINQEITA